MVLAPNTKEEQDRAYSPENLNRQEGGGASGVDPTKGIQEAEENPEWATHVSKPNSPTKTKFDKLKFLKKKGPLAGIIVTLVAGGSGMAGLLLPGVAIVHLKETLVNALDSSDPALSQKTAQMLALKVNGVKNSFADSSDGNCNIRCKFGTMSDTMKRNLEAKGFKVTSDSTRFAGRHVVTSIEFPDGHITNNGAEFTAAMEDNSRASSFAKVFNSKTAYFLNSKFGTMLKTKFGLDKLPKLMGDTKEKVVKSLRSSLGLEGDSAATDPTAKLTAEERARSGKFKPAFDAIDSVQKKVGDKATNVAGAACMLYDSVKSINLAVKAKKIAAYTALAMAVLVLADQIKAGDNPDQAVTEQVGNQITQNDALGKSTFDTVAYKSDSYGDNPGTLSTEDQGYSAAPVGALAVILAAAAGAMTLKGNKAALASTHTVCKLASNPAIGLATTCGTEILVALSTAVETGGVTGIAATLTCVGKIAAIGIATAVGVDVLVHKAKSSISNDEPPSPDENSRGTAMASSLHTGTAQILESKAANNGLKAGTTAEIEQYAIDTASIREKDAAIARYDAKNTPFDAYNQYSFLGSMLQNLNVFSLANSSIMSNLSTLSSLIPHSFSALVTNTSAASVVSQAAEKASLYGPSTDAGLASIGVASDAWGNTSGVMSSAELNADTSSNLDYMIGSKNIDIDTGDAIPGSDYDKYMTNCANRNDPLGETSESVTSDDYEWKVGLRCVETSNELSNFRTYTINRNANDTIDGDESKTATASAVPTPATGTPDNVTAKGSGWVLKDNVDYSAIPCASGTTDSGLYTHPTRGFTIRKCSLAGGFVASIASQSAVDMFSSAKTSGITLKIDSGFRTYEQQMSLRIKDCANALTTPPASCHPPTEIAGSSQHEAGLAFDLNYGGSSGFAWLKANASKFGYFNLPSEAWHWSKSGS